jgi:hypothetical protein
MEPEPLAGRPLDQPHPDRLAPGRPRYDAIMAAHRQALDEGRPTYQDPTSGYWVMTAAYLADRGRCCHQGCRHCPYVV